MKGLFGNIQNSWQRACCFSRPTRSSGSSSNTSSNSNNNIARRSRKSSSSSNNNNDNSSSRSRSRSSSDKASSLSLPPPTARTQLSSRSGAGRVACSARRKRARARARAPIIVVCVRVCVCVRSLSRERRDSCLAGLHCTSPPTLAHSYTTLALPLSLSRSNALANARCLWPENSCWFCCLYYYCVYCFSTIFFVDDCAKICVNYF